jgi:hypothetical protein
LLTNFASELKHLFGRSDVSIDREYSHCGGKTCDAAAAAAAAAGIRRQAAASLAAAAAAAAAVAVQEAALEHRWRAAAAAASGYLTVGAAVRGWSRQEVCSGFPLVAHASRSQPQPQLHKIDTTFPGDCVHYCRLVWIVNVLSWVGADSG